MLRTVLSSSSTSALRSIACRSTVLPVSAASKHVIQRSYSISQNNNNINKINKNDNQKDNTNNNNNNHHNNRSSSKMTLGVSIATMSSVAAASIVFADDNSEEKKKSGGFKESIITRYENKLRQYSTPDKVFRYFATKEVDGEVYMTLDDFIRSVIPGEMQPKGLGLDQFESISAEDFEKSLQKYNPSASKSFFKDVGSAGLISFSEYIFFLTILSTPERRFEIAFKMFDLDGSGTVDLDEFLQVQSVIRKHFGVRGKKSTEKSENPKKSALLIYLFGKDGKKLLTFNNFNAFTKDLQSEIYKLEFESYAKKSGYLTEVAFAELLLSYADLKNEKDSFMARAKARENQQNITFNQFQAFNNFLKNIEDVETALAMYTAAGASITKEDFKRAAKAVANVNLDNHLVDTVFNLFDKDGDGKLSNREFVAVMKKRASRGLDQHRDLGLFRGFKGLIACAKDRARLME